MNHTHARPCTEFVAHWLAKLHMLPPQIPKAVYVKPPGCSYWKRMPYGVFPEDVPVGEGWKVASIDADR